MKRFLLASALFLFPAFFLKAEDDTQALLRQLDDALASASSYEGYFQQHLQALYGMLDGASSPSQRYELTCRLAEEYAYYSVDSTRACLNRNRQIAETLGDSTRLMHTDLLLVKLYARTGYHADALDLYSAYERDAVPESLLPLYLQTGVALYGELGAYSASRHYWTLRNRCLRELKELTQPETYAWYDLLRTEGEGMDDDSLRVEATRKMLSLCAPNSHDYAFAAFFYGYYLSGEQQLQWFIRSAIADVVSATKDYAALNYVAQRLYERGDIDRAFRYAADHCMPDAIFYNGKLRPWQVAQFFPQLEQAYVAKNRRNTRMLWAMVLVAILLLMALAAILWYLFRRNEELSSVNGQLSSANGRLRVLNRELQESSKVRQAYVTRFLSTVSENISTTRQYRNHVLKYIRRGNDQYLVEEIEAQPPIEEDIRAFNKMFDETFVSLYPDFVEKFNALLQDGETIVPKGDDILTPELRVFALIKLGITDSSRIAALLHYSANTIYNYRAKTKNKARGDRDRFEEAVIGL